MSTHKHARGTHHHHGAHAHPHKVSHAHGHVPVLNVMPGQLWFGVGPARIRTLLGSCVGVTLWHPQSGHGGMCHYLLPERTRSPGQPRDGKYGDEAIEMLVETMLRDGGRPEDCQVHLYGGADTMPDDLGVKLNIGERNIEKAWTLIDRYGLNLTGVDVGDTVPRTIELDMSTGTVNCRRGGVPKPERKRRHP